MSSGLEPPRIRRNPALCSKVLAPSPVTFIRSWRLVNAPLASRHRTTAFATVDDRPDTRDNKGTLAVLRSTPTEFTQSSTTVSRVFASSL